MAVFYNLIISTLLAFTSLAGFSTPTSAEYSFIPGSVSGPVTCKADSTHNYSVYLPSYYDEEDVWPVIFLFDPAGHGEKGLEVFVPGAEEFGYILAASNTTENGSWESFLMGANVIFQDVEERFPVDPYRRYTAGFSGAARAASGLAVMYDGILGVIGCGSGFSPNYAPHFDIDFHYIGIIGTKDFHYQEMQKLHQTLSHHKIEHFILEFPGEHAWPPSEVIRDAYIWMEFKAMKHNLARLNYGLIVDFHNSHLHLADSLESAGDIPGAYAETIKLLAYLDDLKRLDQVEEMKNRYLKSPDLQDYMEHFQKTVQREKLYTDAYIEGFKAVQYNYSDGMTPKHTLKWWKKQVKAANAMITVTKAPSDSLLGRRLIDFIWRNAYTYYKSVEGTSFFPLAIQYLDIWKLAQPEAISPYFFSARYHASQGKVKNAIRDLKQAVTNGLEDPLLLENDPELQLLGDDPGYKAILQRLWAGQDL